jgi:hypothetical protein
LWKKWCEDDHLDDIVRCERIASEAVSLFLARASGQAKEDVAELRATIDHSWGQSDAQNAADRASLDRLPALAQEAESLRAKVAELETTAARWEFENTEMRRQLTTAQDERDAIRAEVERLKADMGENGRALLNWKRRAETAESRLAAIRERGKSIKPDDEAPSAVRWVLEDDAPQGCGPCSDGECQTHPNNDHGVATAQQEAKCPSCPHRPHVGMCTGRNGSTANPCPCLQTTISTERYPCTPTCTHDDAANPGHPERVKALSAGVMSTSDGVLSSKAERVKAQSVAVTRAALGLDAKCYAPRHINCPCGWDPPQTCHYPTPDGEPTEAAWKEARELQKAYDRGAEAMRAACLTIALAWGKEQGYIDGSETLADLTHRIEGATP